MDCWFGSMFPLHYHSFAFLSIVTISLALQLVEGSLQENDAGKVEYYKQTHNNGYCDFSEEKKYPFIGFSCLTKSRPHKDYLKYRWKPNGCHLPRFDGRDFLERYRGKKIMFVGDSPSKNMWQSLTCMLHTAIPYSNYTLSQSGLLFKFSLPEYGVSIMFLKNEFLVDMVNEKIGRVLKLDSISTGNQWKGVDMLIFNAFHWWTHTGTSKTWDYFQVGDKVTKEMDRLEAFRIALTTWANWVDSNIDPSNTSVFFQGVSAVHLNGKEWKDPKARNCRGQTQPVKGSRYPGEAIVRSVLSSLRKKVYLLDITLLTQLRKDGHPSLYARKNSTSVDCSHWCLPGVPDAWNEILYTVLLGN
ncbi:Trichome birefringence-like family [Parasponia andersonii]|uniref:Trichome birefringence-like family n=1 Tax=Parasponia andersonii TaxID=3476 RepID=A0A2P5D954_PARAD|nr:Trichome birefringence-like family [Parasponia andersonii]